MKLSNKFIQISQPQDINQDNFDAYLMRLYGEEKFNSKNEKYLNDPDQTFVTNWNNFPYKKQTDVLLNKIKTLSGLNEFDILKSKFVAPIGNGSTREDAELIKSTLEAICYELENNKDLNINLFRDEVKSATLHTCIAGAATNLQKILYSIKPSIYYQKYSYIQSLASNYIRDNNLSDPGMEVHVSNELIHEVKNIYNVIPPIDTYARYRDLNAPASDTFIKHKKFADYLREHFNDKETIYNFSSFVANDILSRLPDQKDLNVEETGVALGETTAEKAMEKLDKALKDTGISAFQILEDNGSDGYNYAKNYQEIIIVHKIREMLDNEIVEHPDLLKIGNNTIIEIPGAWYSYNVEEKKYEKLLDTKKLKDLKFKGHSLEENIKELKFNGHGLEESIKEFLEAGIDFKSSLRLLIEARKDEPEYVKILKTETDVFKELILISDYAQDIAKNILKNPVENDVEEERYKILIDLIENGKESINKVNKMNKKGNTLLASAVIRGKKELAKMLIDNEADINKANEEGDNPLMFAVMNENKELVSILLDRGANINHKNKEGDTPLICACMHNNTEIVEMLLAKGADINNVNHSGYTPLIYAYINGNQNLIEMFSNLGIGLNQLKNNGETPLISAIRYKNKEIVGILLDKGADINLKNKNGDSPLEIATIKNNKEIVEILLDRGADINLKNNRNLTPLERAIMMGNKEIAEILLNKETDINKENKDETILIFAVSSAKIEIAEMILDKGADINKEDSKGNTPLMNVYGIYAIEMAKMLLTRGADVNKVNKKGDSCLTLAIEDKQIDMIKTLLSSGLIKQNITKHLNNEEILQFNASPIDYLLENNKTSQEQITALTNFIKANTSNNLEANNLNIECQKTIINKISQKENFNGQEIKNFIIGLTDSNKELLVNVVKDSIRKLAKQGKGWGIGEIISAFPENKRYEYFSDVIENSLPEFQNTPNKYVKKEKMLRNLSYEEIEKIKKLDRDKAPFFGVFGR